MFYLLHFWLSTLHSIKFHYNSKVRTCHCSTCIEYIYLCQNCTDSVVLVSKSAQHCLYNSGKDRCTRYMWSNDMFVLWNRISAIFYEDRKYCLHIFPKQHALVHGLIFDIMNIQNNQSLEFEWIPMLPPLRSVNDRRFSWLRNVFLKSFQDWLNSA